MAEYNTLFFGLYETFFTVMKQDLGEKQALDIFQKVMEKGLTPAFGSDFKKGHIDDFIRIVGAVDDAVGLKPEFVKVSENEFYFRLYQDLFPNLKGLISHDKIDAVYMPFKLRYMLGDGWHYQCTRHLWNNDPCIEFHIVKKQGEQTCIN